MNPRALGVLLACSFGIYACAFLLVRPALSASPDGSNSGGRPGSSLLVYVGTYTNADSKGIYAFRMDTRTGALTPLGLVAEARNPSFLAVDPDNRFLFAVNETASSEGKPGGAVSSFAINRADGTLRPLNQRSSGGGGPCHITIDHSGKYALVANYTGGSVTTLPADSGGRLGEPTAFIQHQGSSVNPRRQQGPHAHGVYLDPRNRIAVVADLGLDKLLVYRFDSSSGTLTTHDPPFLSVKPGAGPRHLAFHPNGRHAFLINELDSTLNVLEYDPNDGIFKDRAAVSTLPAGFSGVNWTAEVVVHPSGRFVYGSNRGADNVVIYRFEAASGRLTTVGWEPTLGRTPRSFAVDASGQFMLVVNQGSNNLVVFRIDPKTGKPAPAGHTANVGAPVCVLPVPVE